MASPSSKQWRRPLVNPKAAIDDWLNLVDPDGAFLTVTELSAAFPHGFEPMHADQRTELRARAAELDDDSTERSELRRWLLATVLDWDDLLAEDQRLPAASLVRVPEQGVTIRPSQALLDVDNPNKIRVGVFLWPLGTRLERRTDITTAGDTWPASPVQRAETWCRESGVPLALVTDDDQWTLVWAPRGAPAASCRWRLSDLADERILQAGFVSLLGARRFFAVEEDETLERLFERAADAEAEITKGLGSSVRRSVELLVAAISRDDVANAHRVLAGVAPTEVYESAVTVLMRLVFLLFAEERRLLPAEDPLWAESYSVLTLRDDLRAASIRDGEDALERRSSAWYRILATCRAVHGGANHDRLTLPAYGGSLFDPERFPFLEGRRAPDHIVAGGVDLGPAEDVVTGAGRPVAIDDRTVLAILDALLNIKVRSGRTTVTQRVSYKALDVEQIGHCYEGLLDHSSVRIDALAVGLTGPEGAEPEIAIDDLEHHLAGGIEGLCDWLSDKERCNKTASALAKELEKRPEGVDLARLRVACGHNDDTVSRVQPFWGLIRADLRGLPVVLLPGSQFVTQTSTRRNMGAQYTTKALAEEVAQYALEPLVYDPGPQNEADPENWRLRPPAVILGLRICDPAVGSGAILTAAGRYLADRLIESVVEHGPGGEGTFATRLSDLACAAPEEQVVLARREIVDHCLYGVDKNPVAAEMAKLSLWLTTMARERPFTFLDHAIQVGDSLLGITDLEQVRWLHLDPAQRKGVGSFETLALDDRIEEATDLARRLQELSVVTNRDAVQKERLHHELKTRLANLTIVADTVVGAALSTAVRRGVTAEELLSTHLLRVRIVLDPNSSDLERSAALDVLESTSTSWLRTDLPDDVLAPWERRCLHWPLAFPEVFLSPIQKGFDAFISNPPFLGNKYWKGAIGSFIHPLYSGLVGSRFGKPDLVVLFVWRMRELLRVGGSVGFLATQSISEVDSRRFFADRILGELVIFRAISSMPWPGEANVDVAVIWMAKSEWRGSSYLDHAEVGQIGADLQGVSTLLPERLKQGLQAFEGVHNARGLAFVIEADRPLACCAHFAPYVSGEDLVQSDPAWPARYVLDLTGYDEVSLASLPSDVAAYLYDVVRPTRQPNDLKPYPGLEKRWWTFWNTREESFGRSRRHSTSVVMPSVSKHPVALELPSSWVYTNKVVVFESDRSDLQVLLLSRAFAVWLKAFGGSMGTGRRITLANVVETFPLPENSVSQVQAEKWQLAAFEALRVHGPGLTDVMNALCDQAINTQSICRLRERTRELNEAVAASYGLPTMMLVDPSQHDALLNALVERNHQLYAAEVAAGLHDKKTKKAPVKRKMLAVDPAQDTLL